MQNRWVGWLPVLGMAVTGCASTQMYALPMQGAQAQSTFDPLVACAGARNLQSQRQSDAVDVKVEEGAFLRFAVGADGSYAMGTRVNDSVPASQRKAKLDMLKSRGDELYACATQSATPAPQAGAEPVPLQPGAAPQAMGGGACDRLDRCYVEIAKSLCEAKDPRCTEHFHNKIEGDVTACQVTLNHLPDMIAPMRHAKPNWQIPAVCSDTIH